MAKVDNVIEEWLGELKNFEVHFAKSKGFFVKNCPHEITAYTDEFHNKGESLYTFNNDFRLAIQHTMKVMTKTEKVLLIDFSMTAEAYKIFSNQAGFHGYTKKDDEFAKYCASFCNLAGPGFAIDYQIANKMTVGEDVRFYKPGITERDRYGRINTSDNEIWIPYTEESENTLKNIQSQLLQMISTITGFFNKPQKQLEIALKSGNLKMLE